MTVHPPDDADAVFGPKVTASGASTHIQFGIPTRPTASGWESGTIPIRTACSPIESTACWANARGSGGGGGADDDQNRRVTGGAMTPAVPDPARPAMQS